MRKRRKAYNYKFTEREHSKKGIAGAMLALISIISGIVLVAVSYSSKGNGNVYLGSGGILALIFAIVAFVLAVQSVKEENSYRIFPIAALTLGFIALAGWIIIYILGIMII